jgi:hypothetical protein
MCNGHRENPGVCIDLLDGLCQTFFDRYGACPSGDDSECPPRTACFTSVCLDFGYPPLCGPCCPGDPAAAPPVPSTASGPRIYP